MRGYRGTRAVLLGCTGFGCAGLALIAPPAQGAGFALKEQSATALGSAFAGSTAEAADISHMFFNPAGLTRHSGNRASVVNSFIAPTSKPSDVSGQADASLGGQPLGGGDGGSDIGEDALVPAFYGLVSARDNLKFGLGVNVPFGLETNYNDEWAGRYHALNSELATININPNVAYEPVEGVSFGAGLRAQYATAELSNAVDFGSIGAANGIGFAVPTQQDGEVELEGSDWGFGYNLGVMLTPREGTRIGAAYRSKIDHRLDGDADFTNDEAGVASTLQANGVFNDTGIEADLTTPDSINFGIYQEVTDRLAVMGDFQYTFWSEFDELRVEFDNNLQPDNVTEEDWNDVWFAAIGARYQVSDALSLRTGAAFDQSPIPDSTRTPRITGEDRKWVAFGASYNPYPWFGLQAGYTHIFVSDSTVDLDSSDPGGTFRGDLEAEFENSVDIVTIQASLRF